jgi:hypothetical protein
LKSGDSLKAAQIMMNSVLGDSSGWDKLPTPNVEMLTANAKTMGPFMAATPPAVDCASVGSIKALTLIVEGDRSIALLDGASQVLVLVSTHCPNLSMPINKHGE